MANARNRTVGDSNNLIYTLAMADDKPLWKRAFDAVEGTVGPRLEEMVRTEQFADAASAMSKLQNDMRRRAERTMRRTWHFWNLPTGSDVKRMSDQITSLERRVRDLSKRLEDQKERSDG